MGKERIRMALLEGGMVEDRDFYLTGTEDEPVVNWRTHLYDRIVHRAFQLDRPNGTPCFECWCAREDDEEEPLDPTCEHTYAPTD